MLVSTCGIVLSQTDYSETSLIVKVFTELYGLQSYIVKGVRRKGSRIKRNLFGPLSVVDLVAYTKENSGLHLVKDVVCHKQYPNIASDIRKSSVLMFMNELLYRSIPGEMPDPRMFRFIMNSIERLESQDVKIAWFPIQFSLDLVEQLGFQINNDYSEYNKVFDLQEGSFTAIQPLHPYFLNPPLSGALSHMLDEREESFPDIDHTGRTMLLSRILDYFRLHLSSFGEMKSQQILSIVLQA